MSEKQEPKEEPVKREEKPKETAPKDIARAAAEERSKRSSDTLYYWIVIVGFVVMCLVCVVYVFKEWRDSPNLVPAIDLKDIEAFNAKSTSFKRGPNSLFAVKFVSLNSHRIKH